MKFKYRGLGWTVGETQSDTLESRGIYGETHPELLRIELNTLAPRKRLSLTLLHELVHVVCLEDDLGLVEAQVLILANGLFDVLRGNPQLARYILEDE